MIVNSRAFGFKTWHMQLSMIFNRQKRHVKGLDQLLLRNYTPLIDNFSYLFRMRKFLLE